MISHKTHHGQLLNLNWSSALSISTRVLVGKGSLAKLPDLLSQINAGKKVLLLKQPNLFEQKVKQLKVLFDDKAIALTILELPDGEACKSVEQLSKIWNTLHECKFSRQDTIVALGGGTVTDIAGFAASTYMRGINYIAVPTTLLAQIDAAIGGKNGVNFHTGKNLIGNYYFSQAVIVDTDTLATLPGKQFISGLAEVVKTALLEKTIAQESEYVPGPKSLLNILQNSIADLNWDNEMLPGIIIACIKMKLAVVAKDPQESGLRRCLNLGHTLGHALESITDFKISHGEGVAIGMAFAFQMAVSKGQIGEAEKSIAIKLIEATGLPVKLPEGISKAALLESLFRDKKREGEAIRMILPKDVLGSVEYKEAIKREEIEKVLFEFN